MQLGGRRDCQSHQAHAEDDAAKEGQELHKEEEKLVDEPVLVGVQGLGNAKPVIDKERQQEEHKAGKAYQIEVAGPCRLCVHPSRGLKLHGYFGWGAPFRVCRLAVHDLVLDLDCTGKQVSSALALFLIYRHDIKASVQ